MLKFFGTIRKHLLSMGNSKQYLKYAIGEIVLVVIGILIALQINNWNERRKVRKNNTILLQQLLEENRSNLLELTEDSSRDSLTIKMLEFSDFLREESIEEQKGKLRSHLARLFQATSYSFSENYLMSYISSNVGDNSLFTKELIELHSNQKDLAYISEKAFDGRLDNFFNVLAKDIDFQNLEIKSYETLKSFEFRNKITMMALIENEVGAQFKKTLKQQIKVDSIITNFLKN